VLTLAQKGDERTTSLNEKVLALASKNPTGTVSPLDYVAIAALAVKKLGILPDQDFEDAVLAEKGKTDAKTKIPALDSLVEKIGGRAMRCIFVSPLRRTQETASIMWGKSEIPMIGMDMIGEKRSGFPCDTRLPISSSPPWSSLISKGLQEGLLDEVEARSALSNASQVENDAKLRARASHFLEYAASLEGDIGIVSHKGFLRELEKAQGVFALEFSNAESRSYSLTCKDGTPHLDNPSLYSLSSETKAIPTDENSGPGAHVAHVALVICLLAHIVFL